MPELPDVENFKRYFKKTALNKKIVNIECFAKDLIKRISFKDFKNKLIGKSFKDAWRRGKFLIIEIKQIPEKLVFHFGMTGSFYYLKPEESKTKRDRFIRLIFKFEDGDELHWLNLRKLGRVYLVKDLKEIELLKEMGPEPLMLSEKSFLKILDENKEKNIKAVLLDQRIIAGIGNIYSDEILFQAKINPRREIKSLSLKEKIQIYKNMIKILKRAIEAQIPYQQISKKSWLISHRYGDMRCPLNKKHKLKKQTIAGRSAYFCPICQK